MVTNIEKGIKKYKDRATGRIVKGLDKASSITHRVMKKLPARITSKRVLRPSKMTVKIDEPEIESIFDDPNRFFKGEIEEAKRTMFFS
jgi:hypothetical protein